MARKASYYQFTDVYCVLNGRYGQLGGLGSLIAMGDPQAATRLGVGESSGFQLQTRLFSLLREGVLDPSGSLTFIRVY